MHQKIKDLKRNYIFLDFQYSLFILRINNLHLPDIIQVFQFINPKLSMSFRFKQFSVEDKNCPMKVGTDSVLLGAWANLPENGHILDIGTGCGLLALMAAQLSEAQIFAIDINAQSIDQATQNFHNSPWKHRLMAIPVSLQDFAGSTDLSFNHIISNPPYFVNSLKAPEQSRNSARHNDELPFPVLANLCRKLLRPDGKLSLILPKTEAELFLKVALDAGLFLTRRLVVSPFPGRPANRNILEFSGSMHGELENNELFIREHKMYTEDYKQLTRDFYLSF